MKTKFILLTACILLMCTITHAQIKIDKSKKPIITAPKPNDQNPKGDKVLNTIRKTNTQLITPINPTLSKALGQLPEKKIKFNEGYVTTRMVSTNNIRTLAGISPSLGSKTRLDKTSEKTENGEHCVTEYIKVSASSEEFDFPYGTNAKNIYPGAAYKYTEYYSNSLNPKGLDEPRNNIILQLASSSAFGESIEVENPNVNNLNSATGKLKKLAPKNTVNESTSIVMYSTYSNRDFMFRVNAGGGGFGFKANAEFGITNNNRKTYFMIDAIQTFYTITANMPTGYKSFFKDPTKDKNPEALFMSSVSYGRRILGVVETEFENNETKSKFFAEYKNALAGGHAGLDLLNKVQNGKTSVKLYIVGGAASAITVPNTTEKGVLDMINKYMKQVSTEQAVPIKFTFKNMSMSGMRYESATDNFSKTQCTPILNSNPIYNISVKLTTISTEKSKKAKVGIRQEIRLRMNDDKGTPGNYEEPNVQNIKNPILSWVEDRNSRNNIPNAEAPREFTASTTVNKEVNYKALQNHILYEGAYIELKTVDLKDYNYSSKSLSKPKIEKVYLKDILGSVVDKTVQVNLDNGTYFNINFTVGVTPTTEK